MEGPPDAPTPPPPAASIHIASSSLTNVVDIQSKQIQSQVFAKHGLFGKKSWIVDTGPAASSESSDSLTIVTFNVFFGELARKSRALALIETVFSSLPDVVCLQECTVPFIDILKESDLVRDNYRISSSSGGRLFSATEHSWYGSTILTRVTLCPVFFETNLPSAMGRKLLSIAFPIQNLAVSTCHFESLGSAPKRRKQLQIAASFGREFNSHIILGDFNFGDGMENGSIPCEYTDLWPAAHPNDPGLTWNRTTNPTILNSNPHDNWTARADRIILKSAIFRCESIQLIGQEIFTNADNNLRVCPSDHFGLRAVLKIGIN